ncbi:MAG: NAD(P)-binding domain-containing protein [Pseudomonadota bacterium]
MKIGVIGAGSIGRLYAELWHKAGHQVFLSSRTPQDHRSFVNGLGKNAFVGTPAEAAVFGDIILLAVNYESAKTAIEAIKSNTAGKLVIDAMNPLRFTNNGALERMIGEDELAANVIAAELPKARIAKALTTLWSGHVEAKTNVSAPSVAMPYAVDDQVDKDIVAELIAQAGLVPVDLGGLKDSRPLDPGSSIWNVVLTKEELLSRVRGFHELDAA